MVTPPRYFWRRAVAVHIDMAVVWSAYAVLVLLLAANTPPFIGTVDENASDTKSSIGAELYFGNFRPPVYWLREVCRNVIEPAPALADYVAPDKIESAKVCWPSKFGILQPGEVTAQVRDPAQPNLPQRTLIESVLVYQDAFGLAAFLLMSAVCLRLWRTTPGKWLMGLRLAGAQPVPALKREVLRNLPWLLTVLPVAIAQMPSLKPFLMGHLGAANFIAIGLQFTGLIAAIPLWIWPLIRWRGAMIYDRQFGLIVVRSKNPTMAYNPLTFDGR